MTTNKRHIIIHCLKQSNKEVKPEGKTEIEEQTMGMTAD